MPALDLRVVKWQVATHSHVRMNRPAPGLRLEAITPPRHDIMLIWRTLRPVDHAFIRGIIGDVVMFTETPVDWIFLRTAIEFWDPEHADIPAKADRLPFRIQWADSTSTAPARFLQIREIRRQRDASTTQCLYFPEHPTDKERAFSATSAYVARFYPQGSTPPQRSQATPTPRATSTLAPEAESSIQAAMHADLRAVRKERDRLRCELVDSRAEGPYILLEFEVITTGVAPLSDSLTSQNGRRRSSRHLRGSQPAGSGPFSTTSNARSAASDSCRHAPGPNVFRSAPCTGLTDVLRLRRPGQHRGTRGHGQPDGHQHGRVACPTQGTKPSLFKLHTSTKIGADNRSNPWAPPTQAPENIEVPAPPTLHTSMVHPFTSQFPSLSAPTAVPLPPATFLSSKHVLSAPPPISIPAPAMAYTVPPPMFFPASSEPAPTHLQAAELPPYPSLQPHAPQQYSVNLTTTPTTAPTTFLCLHSTNLNRSTIQPHRSHRRRPHSHTITLHPPPLSPLNPGPRCRELLHRCNRILLRRVNRPTTRKADPANNTHRCPLLSLTYIGNSLRGIRFSRYHQVRTSTHLFRISPSTANIIRAHRGTLSTIVGVGFTGHVASPAPFVVDIPAWEPYSDSKVPWTYEGSVGSVEQQFSVMEVTRSGQVYESSAAKDKGKPPAVEDGATPESSHFPPKKVTEEEAEAFMKIVKASEYKVVEQMAKSSAHISLLALLLGSEPPKESPPLGTDRGTSPEGNTPGQDRRDDQVHLLQYHLVLGRRTPVRRMVTLAGVAHCLQFIVDERLITVKGEEDYAIYKETAVPYISVGDDENLSFHSFETISVIRDYGESGPSRADRMIGKENEELDNWTSVPRYSAVIADV
ncbi:hypothetical protein CRG98_034871 [Punica granatum]|uniref:Uncharacterized protein n=1 Tax=Punica granatum TaxID=22663 RepID=A0A2I0IMZ5_PUNGR|nr:hypothetical protein CRG98_034871 [Punica granatum]